MRFLVDARPFVGSHTGGVSRVAAALTSALITRATEDEIVLTTTGARAPALPSFAASATHIHLRIPNKLWSAACFSGIASLDREIGKRTGKIDTMFLPNIGFVGQNISRPYTLLLHDLSFLIERRWFSRRMQWWHKIVRAEHLIKGAAHLFSVSETTKRDATRLLGIPADRVTVIPIGPTIPVVRAPLAGALPTVQVGTRPTPTTKRYIVAFCGDARKNIASAVAAVERLRRDPEFGDVELRLIGLHTNVIPTGVEGSSNGDFKAKISPRRLAGRNDNSLIRVIPNPSDTELADLYTNAACVLYPSWYEGYGLPLHEAAMFGTPRVASSAGALPETAPAGTFFVDPAKPQHMVEALRLALRSPRPAPLIPDPTAWDRAAGIILDILLSF